MEKINLKHVAKDLFCEFNQLYLLIKKYNVQFEFVRSTCDTYISVANYNILLNEVTKIKENLLQKEELLILRKTTIPIDEQYYIYFLFDNDELVYIGQSCVLPSRIGAHQTGKKKKKFNSITTIQTPSTKVLSLEAFYIDKFKPKYNIVHFEGTQLVNYVFENIGYKKFKK